MELEDTLNTQVEFLKSQFATNFTAEYYYSADIWEFSSFLFTDTEYTNKTLQDTGEVTDEIPDELFVYAVSVMRY